jgi:hypothetical protein
MLNSLERAVVLDASVRRLMRMGVRPGAAVRAVAQENRVDWTDVLGAIVTTSQSGLGGSDHV